MKRQAGKTTFGKKKTQITCKNNPRHDFDKKIMLNFEERSTLFGDRR